MFLMLFFCLVSPFQPLMKAVNGAPSSFPTSQIEQQLLQIRACHKDYTSIETASTPDAREVHPASED
jgi:hypothetical protein